MYKMFWKDVLLEFVGDFGRNQVSLGFIYYWVVSNFIRQMGVVCGIVNILVVEEVVVGVQFQVRVLVVVWVIVMQIAVSGFFV